MKSISITKILIADLQHKIIICNNKKVINTQTTEKLWLAINTQGVKE